MFSWNGARREDKFTCQWGIPATDFAPRFAVQVQNALRIFVKCLASRREYDAPALPVEQRFSERLLDVVNSLTDSRLSETERLGCRGEAACLGSPGERLQMGDLQFIG